MSKMAELNVENMSIAIDVLLNIREDQVDIEKFLKNEIKNINMDTQKFRICLEEVISHLFDTVANLRE